MALPRKKRSESTLAPSTARDNPAIVNLEMAGDRLKIFTLQQLLTNKRSKETRDAARLGDVLLPWFEKTITKPSKKLEGIAELWQAHVPEKLTKQSRLVGFLKGTLTVALQSSTMRAELDSQLRGGLLRKLQIESRGALFRVKTCVDSAV